MISIKLNSNNINATHFKGKNIKHLSWALENERIIKEILMYAKLGVLRRKKVHPVLTQPKRWPRADSSITADNMILKTNRASGVYGDRKAEEHVRVRAETANLGI